MLLGLNLVNLFLVEEAESGRYQAQVGDLDEISILLRGDAKNDEKIDGFWPREKMTSFLRVGNGWLADSGTNSCSG